MRTLRVAAGLLLAVLSLSSVAWAQASITGVVKDSSGAVLPGVTVETSSPALIEKVRTAVTDESGRYRIVDLRPGTYTVNFTLTGFQSVRREGIELPGTFTATVDADLRVGSLEETITVTGDSPLVDVQSIRRQTVLDNDVISSIPSSRSYNSLMQLMPNTVTQTGAAMDTQVVPGMVVFGGAGGRSNEGRVSVDGISVGSAFNGAGVSSYIADVGNAREVTMITSGGLGDAENGGPSLNIVPKEGGNSVRGSFFAAGVTQGMIGSNYTEELRASGLTTPGVTRKVWDFNLGIGGPLVQDRLWYFGTFRDEGTERSVPGMFANANAGDPTKWTYVADTTRPAVNAASYRMMALRLTAQATPRNKFAVFWDQQIPCEGGAAAGFSGSACRTSGDDLVYAGSTAAPTPSASATLAPETAAYRDWGNRVFQVKWTAPVTNRLLLEAGHGQYRSRYGGKNIPGLDVSNLIRVVEQCATGCASNGNIPNLTYRSGNWTSNVNWNSQWNAAVSLVTGSHSVKIGYQGALLFDDRKNYHELRVPAVPFQQRHSRSDDADDRRIRRPSARAQRRVLRAGAVDAWPDDAAGRAALRPRVELLPRADGRTGAVLPDGEDLPAHGGGGGLSRPVAARRGGLRSVRERQDVDQGQRRPLPRSGAERRRLHRAQPHRPPLDDNDAGMDRLRRDYRADCDLLNPAAQNLTAAGGDVCGANANANFGTEVFESTLDPALLSGWGVRSGDWQWGASVQHEVLPRVAAEIGYQRRWLVNFTVTDNRARAPEDHTLFGLNIPTDPRLPDGGGGVLEGLYNVTPAAATRLNDNLQTLSTNVGDYTQSADSIYLNVTARPRSGLVLQGGFNTANTGTDYCDVRSAIPEWTVAPPLPTNQGPTNPWCGTSTGWVTRVTGLGTYIDSEGRGAGGRDVPQRPGRQPGRELERAQFGHRRAEPSVCRRRGKHHHRQPDRAGHALR